MQKLTLNPEQLKLRIKNFEDFKKQVLEVDQDKKNTWIDNRDFRRLLKISRKKARYYRDLQLIAHVFIGNKIHYCLIDVEDLIFRRYNYRPG